MLRLFSTIRKELLILLRDKGGLAIMFIMPMAMITIMALIQDGPFRDYMELKIPIVLVNNDTGSLGRSIESGLTEAKIFEIKKAKKTEDELKKEVKTGDYKIGIIIPANSTALLNAKVSRFVEQKLSEVGMNDSSPNTNTTTLAKPDLIIVFAPDTKKSFQASVLGSLRQSASMLETQTMMHLFSKALNEKNEQTGPEKPAEPLINFREVNTIENPKEALLMNSVQHNVPAWTIFGMFFIVISLSGSIITERDEGSYMRILSMPGSYVTVMAGKIASYLFVCLIQCILMLMVGLYILPLLGLPTLIIGNNILAIFIIALSCGLAATGFGVMVGTLFNTHQQSSTFGAVSVVILAALGGIWVPVYVMPETIRTMAEFSPLYWALTAFHKIFLNDGTVQNILPYALKLISFFLATIGIAYFFNRSKNR